MKIIINAREAAVGNRRFRDQGSKGRRSAMGNGGERADRRTARATRTSIRLRDSSRWKWHSWCLRLRTHTLAHQGTRGNP